MIKGIVLAALNGGIVYRLQDKLFIHHNGDLQKQEITNLQRRYYSSVIFMALLLLLMFLLQYIIHISHINYIDNININSLIVCVGILVSGVGVRKIYEGICKCKRVSLDTFSEIEYTIFFLIMCFAWVIYNLMLKQYDEVIVVLSIIMGRFLWFDVTCRSLEKNLAELKKASYDTKFALIIIVDTGLCMIYCEKYILLMIIGEIGAIVVFLLKYFGSETKKV